MSTMTEPTSAVAAAVAVAKAGVLQKVAVMLGVGALGALVMAAFDPPQTRFEIFKHALAALFGSLLFGGPLVRILDYYLDAVDLNNAAAFEFFEWAIPIYFLCGAMSWGLFSALAKFRKLMSERAAQAVYNRVIDKE